jgi:hypothetical protein
VTVQERAGCVFEWLCETKSVTQTQRNW